MQIRMFALSLLCLFVCVFCSDKAPLPVDISGFLSTIDLLDSNTQDLFVASCTRTIASKYAIAMAPREGDGTTAIPVTGANLLTGKDISGVAFDGTYVDIMVSNLFLTRFTFNEGARRLVPVSTLILPSDPQLPLPLAFASEACTACIGFDLGGGTPLIIGRDQIWALLPPSPDDVQNEDTPTHDALKTLAVSYPIANVDFDPDAPCDVLDSTEFSWLTEYPFPSEQCLRGLQFVARRMNPLDQTYRLFFQMEGQKWIFEADGDLNSGDEIWDMFIVGQLYAKTPPFDPRRMTAVHTCQYYIWPDPAPGSTDLFALDAGEVLVQFPFRLTAVTTTSPGAVLLSAFGFGVDVYFSSNANDGKLLRLNSRTLTPVLQSNAGRFKDNCLRNNGGCNITGGHTCVSDEFGFATCLCPEGQDSRPFGCVDLNECDTGRHNCEAPTARCIDTVGSFICACGDGFRSADMQTNCSAIDLCATTTNACAKPSMCVPGMDPSTGAGTFSCQCPSGYVEQTKLCVPNRTADATVATSTGSFDMNTLPPGAYPIVHVVSDVAHVSSPFLFTVRSGPTLGLFLDFTGIPIDGTGLGSGSAFIRIQGDVEAVTLRGLVFQALGVDVELLRFDGNMHTNVTVNTIASIVSIAGGDGAVSRAVANNGVVVWSRNTYWTGKV